LTPRGWALQLDCGVSPVPQEAAHLPLQSAYVQKEAVNNLKSSTFKYGV
jgi:hypothetical protein